jgi:hypothetical protein
MKKKIKLDLLILTCLLGNLLEENKNKIIRKNMQIK